MIFAGRNFIRCCNVVAPKTSGPVCFENSLSALWWFKSNNHLMYNKLINAPISDLPASFSNLYLLFSVACSLYCCKLRKYLPLDKTHLVVMRGVIHQEVSPKCVNEETSTERCSYKC